MGRDGESVCVCARERLYMRWGGVGGHRDLEGLPLEDRRRLETHVVVSHLVWVLELSYFAHFHDLRQLGI